MKKILLFIIFSVSTLLTANLCYGQGSQLPKYTVATLPPASSMPTYIVQVIDGATSNDCTVGGGSYNVFCTPKAGAWTTLGGSGGGYPGVTSNGSNGLNVAGTVVAGTSISAPSVNGVVSACSFPGATADVQIAAAFASLPASQGIVDASCFGTTTQTLAGTIVLAPAQELDFSPSTSIVPSSTSATVVTVAQSSTLPGSILKGLHISLVSMPTTYTGTAVSETCTTGGPLNGPMIEELSIDGATAAPGTGLLLTCSATMGGIAFTHVRGFYTNGLLNPLALSTSGSGTWINANSFEDMTLNAVSTVSPITCVTLLNAGLEIEANTFSGTCEANNSINGSIGISAKTTSAAGNSIDANTFNMAIYDSQYSWVVPAGSVAGRVSSNWIMGYLSGTAVDAPLGSDYVQNLPSDYFQFYELSSTHQTIYPSAGTVALAIIPAADDAQVQIYGAKADNSAYVWKIDDSGNAMFSSIIPTNITPSTSPVCANGTGGALTTTGCTGGTGGSYLPLSGGTLTGALNGTSASFSGNVAAGTTTPTTIGPNGVLLNGVPALQSQTSLNNYYSGGAGNLTGTGNQNTANGFEALYFNTTGSYNSAQGGYALYFNTTGIYNSAQGFQALYSNTTGSGNSAQGFEAGLYISDGSTANAASSSSVYLGARTEAKASGDTNENVIGNGAVGNGSNTTTLGNTATVGTYINGALSGTSASFSGTVAAGGISSQTSITLFGNSIFHGEGVYDPVQSVASLLSSMHGGPAISYAYNANQIGDSAWTGYSAINKMSPKREPLYVVGEGTNNAGQCGASAGCQSLFEQEYLSFATFLGLQSASMIYATNPANTLTGTWYPDYVLQSANSNSIPASPMAKTSFATGSTLTMSITTTNGNPIIENWGASPNNGGTATITIDGVPTSLNGFGSISTVTTNGVPEVPFAQVFPVASGPHSVVITVTSTPGSVTTSTYTTANASYSPGYGPVFTVTNPGYAIGQQVVITNCTTNTAWNGAGAVISKTPTPTTSTFGVIIPGVYVAAGSGTDTCVVNTNPFTQLWIGSAQSGGGGLNTVLLQGMWPQYNGANAATITAYDNDIQSVVSTMQSAGFPTPYTSFVPVLPYVNTTTDMASGIAYCSGVGNGGLHPNCNGAAHTANAYVIARPDLFNTYVGHGSTFTTPVQVNIDANGVQNLSQFSSFAQGAPYQTSNGASDPTSMLYPGVIFGNTGPLAGGTVAGVTMLNSSYSAGGQSALNFFSSNSEIDFCLLPIGAINVWLSATQASFNCNPVSGKGIYFNPYEGQGHIPHLYADIDLTINGTLFNPATYAVVAGNSTFTGNNTFAAPNYITGSGNFLLKTNYALQTTATATATSSANYGSYAGQLYGVSGWNGTAAAGQSCGGWQTIVGAGVNPAVGMQITCNGVYGLGFPTYVDFETGEFAGMRMPVFAGNPISTYSNLAMQAMMWFNSTTKQFGYYDGAASQTITTMTAATPADNATCTAGALWFDSSYLYVCTASGTVKRAALTAF